MRLTMKALLPAMALAVILVPKTNEQIGAETDAFPADEKHQKIISQHQQKHEENKQVQVNEEPDHPFIMAHVAESIDMDQKTDAGDDEQHYRGQRIRLKR